MYKMLLLALLAAFYAPSAQSYGVEGCGMNVAARLGMLSAKKEKDMETVVCTRDCTTFAEIAEWVATLNLNERCVLVRKGWNDNLYREGVVVSVRKDGVAHNGLASVGTQGNMWDVRSGTQAMQVAAGSEFYVIRHG